MYEEKVHSYGGTMKFGGGLQPLASSFHCLWLYVCNRGKQYSVF